MKWRGSVDSVPRQRALTTLSLMRSGNASLTHAARLAGTTRATVRKHVGSALRREPSGRYRATPADRFTRALLVLTTSGIEDVDVRGSRVASIVAEHWNAVQHFLASGDASRLAEFRGKAVAGKQLETNPEVIERLGRRGVIDLETIYRL